MRIGEELEHKRIELRSIEKDMYGLNPKTSLYQRLAAKHAAILAELELLSAKRTAHPALN